MTGDGLLGQSLCLVASACRFPKLEKEVVLGRGEPVKVAKISTDRAWDFARQEQTVADTASADPPFPSSQQKLVPRHDILVTLQQHSTALCSTLLSSWAFPLPCFSPGSRADMLLPDTNCTTVPPMYDTFESPAVSLATKCGEKS